MVAAQKVIKEIWANGLTFHLKVISKITPLDRIEALKTAYEDLPHDTSDLLTVMNLKKEMSSAFWDFSKELAAAKRESEIRPTQRKAEYFTKKRHHETNGENSTKAATIAECDVIELRKMESIVVGQYGAMKVLSDGTREVLSTMQQHISLLKMEKNETMKGQANN